MPMPARPASPPQSQESTRKVEFSKPEQHDAHRAIVYGTGGIGKTSLGLKLPGRTAWFDFDMSLSKLQVPPSNVVVPGNSWRGMRDALQASGWDGIRNIVIDSMAEVDRACRKFILSTIKTEAGTTASSIEAYGWGKGYGILYEQHLNLLADLEKHFRAGRNIILICHAATSMVPNPEGEDWLRYEPDLYQGNKVSLRDKLKNWCDHVLFFGYDVVVKDGVGKGAGTRTLYPSERPHCLAKSRVYADPVPIEADTNPWPLFGIK